MSDASKRSAPEAAPWLEGFLMELETAGTPEETLRLMVEEIRRTHDPDAEHHCAVCGRSSGAIVAFEKDDGTMTYSFPSRFVYAYRDRRPHGLCDQCFAQASAERHWLSACARRGADSESRGGPSEGRGPDLAERTRRTWEPKDGTRIFKIGPSEFRVQTLE